MRQSVSWATSVLGFDRSKPTAQTPDSIGASRPRRRRTRSEQADRSGGERSGFHARLSLVSNSMREGGALRIRPSTVWSDDEDRKPPDSDASPGDDLLVDLDHDACYRAMELRDARFDGRFFA